MLPLEEFAHNVLIAGESESDKTAMLSIILNHFTTQAPEVGIIYFTFDKGFDKTSIDFDYSYEYGSPGL